MRLDAKKIEQIEAVLLTIDFDSGGPSGLPSKYHVVTSRQQVIEFIPYQP